MISQALADEQVATAADIDAIYDACVALRRIQAELDSRSDVNISLLVSRVDALETKVDEQGPET